MGRPRGGCAREANLRPPPTAPIRGGGGGATRCVTPRQACPRPEGLGRNLRSKTRWFTGFCNSHQVSHFATFFIDARAEISVAESRLDFMTLNSSPSTLEPRATGACPIVGVPWRFARRGLFGAPYPGVGCTPRVRSFRATGRTGAPPVSRALKNGSRVALLCRCRQ